MIKLTRCVHYDCWIYTVKIYNVNRRIFSLDRIFNSLWTSFSATWTFCLIILLILLPIERKLLSANINRCKLHCSLHSCRKGSKISGYLSIQSILMQPLLDNMKDVFDRVQAWCSCWNINFQAPISSQADLALILSCEG